MKNLRDKYLKYIIETKTTRYNNYTPVFYYSKICAIKIFCRCALNANVRVSIYRGVASLLLRFPTGVSNLTGNNEDVKNIL